MSTPTSAVPCSCRVSAVRGAELRCILTAATHAGSGSVQPNDHPVSPAGRMTSDAYLTAEARARVEIDL